MRESVQKSKKKIRDFKAYKETCQNVSESEKYLKLHPNCPFGKLEKATALKREMQHEEAKPILEELLETKNYKYAIANLICLEYSEQNFKNCYDYLNQLEKYDKDYFYQVSFKYLRLFCMQQLNIPINIDYDNLDFMEKIILDYDIQTIINHIAYHDKNVYAKKNKIVDFNEKDYDECFFASDINIPALYYDVMDILKLDEIDKSIDDAISSKIFFRYDNIGSNVRGKKNYLVVMNLTHTDKIISLYPVEGVDREYLANKHPVYDFFELKEKAKIKKHYRQ